MDAGAAKQQSPHGLFLYRNDATGIASLIHAAYMKMRAFPHFTGLFLYASHNTSERNPGTVPTAWLLRRLLVRFQ
jgi:hypothetical protein